VIEKLARLGTTDIDFAHVADVEQAGGAAHHLVLFEDAAVLDRHFPAGEIDQPGAMGRVKIAQRGALEFAHGYDYAPGRETRQGSFRTTSARRSLYSPSSVGA